MEDYPRASHFVNTNYEIHLDLQVLMIEFAKTMFEITGKNEYQLDAQCFKE